MTVVTDFLTAIVDQSGFVLLILCVLLVIGAYTVSIFRDYAAEDREEAPMGIANLEEMHRKGDISDQEFRKIKTKTDRFPVGPDAVEELISDADSSANEQS